MRKGGRTEKEVPDPVGWGKPIKTMQIDFSVVKIHVFDFAAFLHIIIENKIGSPQPLFVSHGF